MVLWMGINLNLATWPTQLFPSNLSWHTRSTPHPPIPLSRTHPHSYPLVTKVTWERSNLVPLLRVLFLLCPPHPHHSSSAAWCCICSCMWEWTPIKSIKAFIFTYTEVGGGTRRQKNQHGFYKNKVHLHTCLLIKRCVTLSHILPSYSLQKKADKTMNLCNSQLPRTRVEGENNFVSLSIIYSLPILALNLCRAGHKAITPTSEEFWWGSAQKWSTSNLLNLKFVLQNETHMLMDKWNRLCLACMLSTNMSVSTKCFTLIHKHLISFCVPASLYFAGDS